MNMTDIRFTITFHSEWHCGSGLTSGSDLDALAVRDKDRLPFVPGKTLKGLLKEAAIEICKLEGNTPETSDFIKKLFGYFDEEAEQTSKIHTKGEAFFGNAVINDDLRAAAKANNYTDYFYRSVSSTAIRENGIAQEHSLRRMETVIPCELVAMISNVNDMYVNDLVKCMQYVKRLGQNRNRGLGRCTFEVVEIKKEAAV